MKFRKNFHHIFVQNLQNNLITIFHVTILRTILNNAFPHLQECAPIALILLSSSTAFSLKPSYRSELRAIVRNSQTRAK